VFLPALVAARTDGQLFPLRGSNTGSGQVTVLGSDSAKIGATGIEETGYFLLPMIVLSGYSSTMADRFAAGVAKLNRTHQTGC